MEWILTLPNDEQEEELKNLKNLIQEEIEFKTNTTEQLKKALTVFLQFDKL